MTMLDFRTKDLPRFMSKVEVTPTCWLWNASKNDAGYGQFGMRDRPYGAHRVAYMLFVGPIPDDLVLDHLCRNPSCVNPRHLEAVTAQVNARRGLGGELVTSCPAGHPYSPENTYNRKDRPGRMCRTCMRERYRAPHAQDL